MVEDGYDSNDELRDLLAEYQSQATDQMKTVMAQYDEKPKTEMTTAEGKAVEKLLFGDKKGLIKNLAKAVGQHSDAEDSDEEDETSRKVKTEDSVDTANSISRKRKPAWVDPDDEEIDVGEVKGGFKRKGMLAHAPDDKSYKEYLTKHFTRVVAQPKWARPDYKAPQEDSDEEGILKSVGFLAKPATGVLPQQYIQCKRLKDLNRSTVAQYSGASVTSIQFHPSSTAALVAASNGLSTIYSIDGTKNEKLHSMMFKKFQIKCAKLKPCGTKAIFGSVHKHYYHYDLMAAKEVRYFVPKTMKTLYNFQLSPCGRFMISADDTGAIHLMSVEANELIHTFQFGEYVTGLRFDESSQRIICNCKSSQVKIFSLRQQRQEHMFIDEGCISGRVLDLAPNQRLLATGSNEGVVNVYDYESVYASPAPRPIKTFLNLVTAISDVKFNHSSELLAMCSKVAPNATKLAHFPSATVYADYPLSNQVYGRVAHMEFSPSSGFLALGGLNKEIPLLRLKHFANY